MGCVPSSHERNSSVENRASSSTSKPQKNVELATKSVPKATSSTNATPIVAPKDTEKDIDRGVDANTKKEESSSANVKTEEPASLDGHDSDPADTSIAPQETQPPLVIDTKISESSTSVKEDPKAGSDELMLDFDTFVLIPEVQQVLKEGSVKTEMLQDLFDIVDKDADGFVNEVEREDLLELISLSYGAKSKPTTPVNKVLPPVPTLVLTAPAQPPVEPEPETNPRIETDAKFEVEAETKTEAEAPAAVKTPVATEESAGGVSPLTSDEGTSSKSTKRKPKIIKFISPQLVVPGAAPHVETKSAETSEAHSPTTPTHRVASTDEEARDLPPQKKGFMVTRRERESFGSRDSTEQGQSRFFVLDNGTLSYMDSTSRKPPFSMTHREIALKGVDVQVKNNTIELTPLATSSSEAGEQDEDAAEREIVILELKNEKECAVWMDAIREHMKFSVDAE